MRRLTLPRLRLWWERAFWVIPLAGVLAGLLLQNLAAELDEAVAELGDLELVSAAAAGQVLAAIGGGMVTFTGFVFSFVVLILQFGSSQYSPRSVTYFLRARSTQVILAIFLLTITFTFLSLLDIGSLGRQDFAPQVAVVLAVGLLLASLVGFIVLLASIGGRVRVDAVLSAFGRHACEQLPRRLAAPAQVRVGAVATAGEDADDDGPDVLKHRGRTGQVVAVDGRRLVRLARRHRLHLEVVVRVGDSVTAGTPVARCRPTVPRRARRAVARCVVVDVERSLGYDPLYALRLLVDVALRALSPAINDPTTAVRALDEIEPVLRTAAGLPLGPRALGAGAGVVVLTVATWEDVVDLALLEITLAGAGQPQVTRRLTALVDDLAADVPATRVPTLDAARARLVTETRAARPGLAPLALTPDRQGLGAAR